MRTTLDLDDDVAKAVQQLRRSEHLGASEAVNTLIRRGLLRRDEPAPFQQPTRSLGITIDVSNVAEALDLLEGSEAR